jgi:hypothetical protein
MWNDFEARDRGLLEVLFRHLPLQTEKPRKKSIGIAGGPAGIRNKHLQNTSLDRYG